MRRRNKAILIATLIVWAATGTALLWPVTIKCGNRGERASVIADLCQIRTALSVDGAWESDEYLLPMLDSSKPNLGSPRLAAHLDATIAREFRQKEHQYVTNPAVVGRRLDDLPRDVRVVVILGNRDYENIALYADLSVRDEKSD